MNKSVDGVLGIRTWNPSMGGAYESTELWWPYIKKQIFYSTAKKSSYWIYQLLFYFGQLAK